MKQEVPQPPRSRTRIPAIGGAHVKTSSTGGTVGAPWMPPDAMLDTRLGDLVPCFDTIAAAAIPYARLPRRLSGYAKEFCSWADIADQTPRTLLRRPKFGDAAVAALLHAAHDTVHAHAQAAAAGPVSAEQAITALLDRLTDFDRALLDGRRWRQPPATTTDLAHELGTSATSIARSQPRADQRFAELLNDPLHAAVRDHAARLADQLGPLLPDDLTTAALRGLRLDPAGQPARALLYLAGPYRPHHDGWTENLSTGGHERIHAAVDDLFARNPAPSLDMLHDELSRAGMTEEASWAFLRSQPAWRRFGDVYVHWNPDNTADMAEAVLHAIAEPLTPAQIHAAIGADVVSIHTLSDALREHRRFVRASRQTWALAAWRLDQYTNIADAIGTTIDRLGGKASADDIVADVLARFPDVAESSIRSFLHTLAFVNDRGSYRRRRRRDPFSDLPPLRRVRGAYQNGPDEIRYALTADVNTLRGSAPALPAAVANAAGVQPGQRKTFANPHGDINVFWQLTSVRGAILSSIRAQAAAGGAQPGDTLVLSFTSDQVSITCIPAHVVGLPRLKTLLGRRVRNPAAALAASLECKPNEVPAILRARGDDHIADQLL